MTDDTDLRQWLSALHAKNKEAARVAAIAILEHDFEAAEATLHAWGLDEFCFERDYNAGVLLRGSIQLRPDGLGAIVVRDLEWTRDYPWIKAHSVNDLAAIVTEGGFVE